jgi:hypothetical protein
MKLDLSVPAINIICNALQALQQQTAVVLEQIAEQANAQQQAAAPPADTQSIEPLVKRDLGQ